MIQKNVWYRLQLCHLWFEIVMNRPLIWLRILTTQFLYGKIALQTECEWNILSIVGLPALVGDEKKGWHLWNLAVPWKGVCSSSCSCGVCWELVGLTRPRYQCTVLGEEIQRLAFHTSTGAFCGGHSYNFMEEIYCGSIMRMDPSCFCLKKLGVSGRVNCFACPSPICLWGVSWVTR